MAQTGNVHPQPPIWLQMWHAFELTSTGIAMLLLLLIVAVFAIYGD